jgi:hypothetical protein
MVHSLHHSVLAVALSLLAKSLTAANFPVTNTADSGPGSLRQAILAANANTGIDTISFAIPGAGVHTIHPASDLPAITDTVVLDGTTQPGFSGTPLIELTGNGGSSVGLSYSANQSVLTGLAINGWYVGVTLSGNGNVVTGNFVGTVAAGLVPRPNIYGIRITGSSNRVGGTTPAERNVLSGNTNGFGISIDGTAATTNIVEGNFIGADVSGCSALPNFNGLIIQNGAANNTVGGNSAGAGNVVSGNQFNGLVVLGGIPTGPGHTDGNVIQGNWIGTCASGAPLGNRTNGIQIDPFNPGTASNNQIGGAAPGAGNVIAHNGGAGVLFIDEGPFLIATGNSILGNSIHSNAALGIDIGGDGVTPNDIGDADTGPNNRQNFPILTWAASGGGHTTILGTFNSEPSKTYRIEFFFSPACDSSGHGQGKTFLGFWMITTDSSGNASLNADLFTNIPRPASISATATDPAGNTSEFSNCVPVDERLQFYTVTPCRVVDTRNPVGPYGAPALQAGANRAFVFGGQCAIPPTARAVALNVAIVKPTDPGFLVLSSGAGATPPTSTINYRPGNIRANNAIVSLGGLADLTVHCGQGAGTTDMLIDVVGYFQ